MIPCTILPGPGEIDEKCLSELFSFSLVGILVEIRMRRIFPLVFDVLSVLTLLLSRNVRLLDVFFRRVLNSM